LILGAPEAVDASTIVATYHERLAECDYIRFFAATATDVAFTVS